MYTVTYRESSTTTLDQHNALESLPTEDVELEEVLDNCAAYGCDADLYDAAGFRKGWVHADGTYTLT